MAFTQGSDYWEEQKLNYLLGSMDTAPSSIKVALFVGNPGDDGSGGSDVSATINGSGKVTATFSAPALNGSGVYEISNTATVDFGNSAAEVEGTVNYCAVYVDTGMGDELIAYALLDTPLTIMTSDPVSIGAGEIKISLDANWAATAQQDLLNWIRGTDPTTSISDLYVALYTSEPGIGNTGTEVTSSINASGRVLPATGWNGPDLDGTTFKISNDGKIDFGASDNTIANPVNSFGIFNASSAGTLLFWGALTESVVVNAGNNVFFDVGQLVLRAA
jgi:hypothetical protein